VGRVGSLTADPLRFAEPAAVALAVQRLDRAASLAAPLQAAWRSLAVLTCLRLEALISPQRGDEALAAALARYAETAIEEPASPARAHPARRAGHAAVLPAPRPAPSPARRPSLPRREARRAPAVTTSAARTGARRVEARRVAGGSLEPVDLGAPAATEATEVHGLEWLVGRVPGGTEAAESPLDLAASVDDVEPLRPAVASGTPARGPEGTQPSAHRDVPIAGHASEPRHAFAPAPAAAPTPAASPAAAGAAQARRLFAEAGGELETLVRAFDAGAQADESYVQTTPPAYSPQASRPAADAEPATEAASAAGRPHAAKGAHTQAREEELLGLGDELGRVLVAELRRYGIEVGA